MKALTLHRPWARFVANGEKRIENRGWAPPLKLLGQRIAIHAGRHWADEGAEYIEEVLGLKPSQWPAADSLKMHPEGIIGTARLIGWCHLEPAADGETMLQAPGAGVEYTELLPPGQGHRDVPIVYTPRDREWMFGPVCWVLRDAVMLAKPVPCRGLQKLWEVKADVQKLLDESLAITPVQCVLPCPGCGKFHVDREEWSTRLHHTHRCEHCGREWEIKLAAPHHSTYAVGADLGTELRPA